MANGDKRLMTRFPRNLMAGCSHGEWGNRMRSAALFALATLALAPTSAPAAMTATGNELLDTCKNENSMFSSGTCLGFIDGVVEGMRLQASAMNQKALVCPPDGATFGQMRDVLIKFLSDHPEQRHFSGAQVTVIAFSNAWRCDFGSP